ncbi:restriction endonuclease subunit S [Campylobacter concisus]|uniref:restriction endonuclease subunit S n=1 Tax=Campylobacter concisus TaxID=199 RepID=UPI000CD8F1AE|nr:restriction endonuclease subunit S [Campylobacter concisus]
MSEFKNLPSGWKVVKLGDVFDIQSGSTPSRQNFYYWENTSIYWVKTTDLNNSFISDTEEKISEIGLKESSCKVYPKNTILIAMYGGFNQIGRTGILKVEAATNQAISALLPSTKANSLFVNNILICHRNKWKNIAISSRKDPNITKRDIENFKIPLPPLDEQEKIAEILSTWDEAINLTINLIESKKQFKKALMQNLLTAKIRFPQFKDEWQNEKLNKVTFFQEGPGVRNTQYKKEGIKLLNVGNLNNNTLNLNTTTTYISETEAYGAYKHFLIDDGDLLISCSGINSASFKNKIAFAEKKDLPLCLNTSTMRFKSLDDRLLLKYLYYFFQTIYFERQVLGVLTGSAQFNFGPTHIKWFKIKLPNLKEQQKIVEVLTACDDEINLLNLKLENLKRQKQGLMQKLLSGKVRVK